MRLGRLSHVLATPYRRLTPSAYRRLTLVTLASLVAIIVTGAGVRLTGSGLGCSTWPSCEPDSFAPTAASGVHGTIEFVNRLVTGVVMAFTLVAVVGAYRFRHQRRDLLRWSLGLPVWVLGNAVVGGMVVLLHLSPLSVIGHFLVSIGSVWNAAVLHQRASEPVASMGDRRHVATPVVVSACRLLLVAAGVVLVTGTVVTGSGPHAGDERADRLDVAVGDAARVHGVAVVLFLALTLAVLWMVRRGDGGPGVDQRVRELLVVLVAQGVLGYTQYFTGVPPLLVGGHVLGAALVWVATVRVFLGLSEPAPSPAGPEADAVPSPGGAVTSAAPA